MGSSGGGNFSDYSQKPKIENGGGGSSGGASGSDKCAGAFSAELEDIEQYGYFSTNGTVPPVSTPITVEQRKRLVALDSNGVELGALPTSMNFLAACIGDGFTYSGVVSASAASPTSRIKIDFAGA